MKINLLSDPCLEVRMVGGDKETLSLPGLLSRLQRDQIESFPALLPHQAHPWHAFLCQLAALVLEGKKLPPVKEGDPASLLGRDSEERWRRRLRSLTSAWQEDEPWCLVVEDLQRPAFMQPPLDSGEDWSVLKKHVATPDELDVLVTSRNHGVKTARMLRSQAQHWIFALVSLQTQGGYEGAGNYGIARQNGGYASRPGISLAGGGPGRQWARDVRVMLERRDYFRQDCRLPFDQRQGVRLLWLEPWDGKEASPIERLHPWFIEICRRVRLRSTGEDGIEAWRRGSKGMRVAAEELKGNLCDPWISIKAKDGAAFNSRPEYAVMQEVIFDQGQYQPSLLQQFHPQVDWGETTIRFRVLVRGQGRTAGYQERQIPVPAEQRDFIFGSRRARGAETARDLVDLAKAAEDKVLKPALLRFMQAAREELDYKQKETVSWSLCRLEELDRQVDQEFFPLLWQCLELRWQGRDGHEATEPWRRWLRDQVRSHFRAAIERLPVSSAWFYRARALAEKTLESAVARHLMPISEKGGEA